MLELGPLAFASPWILVALASLPVIWWLLRVTPPSPRLLAFPPIRFVLALRPQEETPARTPWWLILMRMLLAALVIVALAHPMLNPDARLGGSGPLLIVVDNGWGGAADWPARQRALDRLIDMAAREDRAVGILATARSASNEPITVSRLMRAADARQVARALAPHPWPSDYAAARAAVDALSFGGSVPVVWLSDGLGSPAATALAERLQRLGSLRVLTAADAALPHLIGAPESTASALSVPVRRASGVGEAALTVRASSDDGRVVAQAPVRFADGETQARAEFELPSELRNTITRLEIEGESSAGAALLLDERWRRRPVGLISGETIEKAQPLLSSLYYLGRALSPFSEVRRGTIDELLGRDIAVMMLADIGRLTGSQVERLGGWIERGGVVVRFAGPHLAQSPDSLIPVKLRGGGRAVGGAMSWAQPLQLMPFAEASPFSGLAVPEDVRVSEQVLAEPSLDLDSKTWARLTDGTPLVTAEKRGQGWLVLVHTTADTSWSNLAISGLFVQMMQRVVELSQGVISDDKGTVYPPLQALDGFGRLGPAPSAAVAIAGKDFAQARPGPQTPPGFYGRGSARRALNLGPTVETLAPLGALPAGVARGGYGGAAVVDFKPWLLLAALLLALADLAVGFVLRGLLQFRPARAMAACLAALLLAGLPPAPAEAQSDLLSRERPIPDGPDKQALMATLETRLAYVLTGDAELDDITRSGMVGLSDVLRRRTAVEPGAPMAVDVERDELAYFPMLYWAVSPAQPPLSDRASAKLNEYMRSGGAILFDTREQGSFTGALFGNTGAAGRRLRLLLSGLDVPALVTVPEDHVLTKSFYLIQSFPGRWTGGAVWVERRGGRHNDGVSSIIIGSNDWAGAWAVDGGGRPMFPAVPGGEGQREMAFRFGVNWVMYVLTGNYKTDQVHVPAIIERLGQ